jgi:hypothetical protein
MAAVVAAVVAVVAVVAAVVAVVAAAVAAVVAVVAAVVAVVAAVAVEAVVGAGVDAMTMTDRVTRRRSSRSTALPQPSRAVDGCHSVLLSFLATRRGPLVSDLARPRKFRELWKKPSRTPAARCTRFR